MPEKELTNADIVKMIGDTNRLLGSITPVVDFLAKHAVFSGNFPPNEAEFVASEARRLKDETMKFRQETTVYPPSPSPGKRGSSRHFLVIAECGGEIGCENCGWLVNGECTISGIDESNYARWSGAVLRHKLRFDFIREIGEMEEDILRHRELV